MNIEEEPNAEPNAEPKTEPRSAHYSATALTEEITRLRASLQKVLARIRATEEEFFRARISDPWATLYRIRDEVTRTLEG